MKKLIVLFMCLAMIGCAGTTIQNTSKIDQVVDIGFVAFLIAKPELKPVVVDHLKNIKALLETDISYKTLTDEIVKRFPETSRYAPLAPLILQLIGTDKPVSEEWLTMFDAQKQTIAGKIDHLLLLAGG